MKKFRLPLLALLAVVVATAVVVTRRSGTVREELRDFAVKDTASITKIFLGDRKGNSIVLKRTSGSTWLVNDSFPARRESIKLLLEVIYRVDVKTRVSKSAYNTVIKDLASTGIKVEIYTDDPATANKVYYVGGHTEDALGTFMMLEGSSLPFVTEIPGFNGYLTPWYPTHLSEWRDKVVFAFPPDQIKKVDVLYPAFPDRSFTLDLATTGPRITCPSSGQILTDVDTAAMTHFISLFSTVPYESLDRLITDRQKDSIGMTAPLCLYTVTDASGQDHRLRIHPMPVNAFSITALDSLGQPLKYDMDRMLAYMEKEKQWVTIQHFTFDPLLRQFSDFDSKKRKSTKAVN